MAIHNAEPGLRRAALTPTAAVPLPRTETALPLRAARMLARIVTNEAVQVGALLLLAAAIRLALHARSPAFVGKDSQSYFLPGWELARAQPFEIGERRTPGYPLFIAAVILTLGEELRGLALAQHLVGLATVAVTYLLGRCTFGRAAGLLAGLLVALNGPMLIYERYVMSETLFGFLLSLTLLAAVAAARAVSRSECEQRSFSGWWRWALAGIALGLAVLTRPVAQLLFPLLVVTAQLSAGRQWRHGLVSVSALATGLVLILVPWIVRNALEKGNPSASTFGRTLIARTAYYDRGFVFDVPGSPHPDPAMQRAREVVQDGARQRQSDGVIAGRLRQELGLTTPVEVNKVMRDVALGAIARNPEHFVIGTVAFALEIFAGVDERLRDHWDEYKDANPWNERIRGLVVGPNATELTERPSANRLVNIYQPTRYASALGALFLLGLMLAALSRRYRAALLPGITVVTLLLASAALDGPVERYRYPLDPLIAVLAAGALSGSLQLLHARLRPSASRAEQRLESRAATPA